MCVCDKKHNCHASPKNGAEPALGLKSHLLEEAISPRVFLSGLWRITLGDNGFFLGPATFSELLISTYSVNNFIPQSVPSESHDVLLLSYIYELIQISKLIHYLILGEMNNVVTRNSKKSKPFSEDVSNIEVRRTNTSTRDGRNNASLSTQQQQSNSSAVAFSRYDYFCSR